MKTMSLAVLASVVVACCGAAGPEFGAAEGASAPQQYTVSADAMFTGASGTQQELCKTGDLAVRGNCEATGGAVTAGHGAWYRNQMGWSCTATPADTRKGEYIFATVWCEVT